MAQNNVLLNDSRGFPKFFCITGQRGARKTSVFEKLKVRLPGIYPHLKFAFFEDPFASLPHPMVWAEAEGLQHPVSRLFLTWALMNEATQLLIKKLQSLERPDVMLIDGFGANAVLYATACVRDCMRADDEVFSIHQDLVDARILRQGILPPLYIDCKTQPDLLRWQLRKESPEIGMSFTNEELDDFFRYEDSILRRYFKEGSGQTLIGTLDASLDSDEMTEVAVRIIASRICHEQEVEFA